MNMKKVKTWLRTVWWAIIGQLPADDWDKKDRTYKRDNETHFN